jgi:hypothetical protein
LEACNEKERQSTDVRIHGKPAEMLAALDIKKICIFFYHDFGCDAVDIREALVASFRAVIVDRLEPLGNRLEKIANAPHINKTLLRTEQINFILNLLLHVCNGALGIGERLAIVRLPDFESAHFFLQRIECAPFLCAKCKVRTNTNQPYK